MLTKKQLTIWLDNDGVAKDDIEDAFKNKGFAQLGPKTPGMERLAYNTFKELMFISLHLFSKSSAKSMNGDGLPLRSELAGMAKGWIEEGKNSGLEIAIGVITSNPTVDGGKLRSQFREAGVDVKVVHVKSNTAKGGYLNVQPGHNILVDDNYFSFLRLDTNRNSGIALRTDYTDMMRRFIVGVKGVENANSLDDLDKIVRNHLRTLSTA
ncbi:MAG: hypothetical protein QXK65_01105 [Candidatus Micrarchaeaceae archaeon]